MDWLKSKEEDYHLFRELIIRVIFIKSKKEEMVEQKVSKSRHESTEPGDDSHSDNEESQYTSPPPKKSQKSKKEEIVKPTIPAVLVMNVATSESIGALRERIKRQYDLQFEHQFIFSFQLLTDEDPIPVTCFESIEPLNDDDFYRPRLLLTIDLDTPFQVSAEDKLHLSPTSERANSPDSRGSSPRSRSRPTSARSRLLRGRSRQRMTADIDLFGGTENSNLLEEDGDALPLFPVEEARIGEFDVRVALTDIGCEMFAEALIRAGYQQESAFAALTEEDFDQARICAPRVSRQRILLLAQRVAARLTSEKRRQSKPLPRADYAPTAHIIAPTDANDVTSLQSGETKLLEFATKAEFRKEWERRGRPRKTTYVGHDSQRKILSANAVAKIQHIQREEAARKQIDEALSYYALNTVSEDKHYCCDTHQHSTLKQQDLLCQHEAHRIMSSLRFSSFFQTSLGDTLTSLELSAGEIMKVLQQLGYSSVNVQHLLLYLQRHAQATDEEVKSFELYQNKGFHNNMLPQHQSLQSVYSVIPTRIFSKERVVESTVQYMLENHHHELLRKK